MIIDLRGAFAVFCCAFVLLFQDSCMRHSYQVQLSGPVNIGNEWTEFRFPSPLKADTTFQHVLLELDAPFEDDFHHRGNGPNAGKGILLPSGMVINPEIVVLDQFGNEFTYVYSGGRGVEMPIYDLQYPNKLPRDRQYISMKIRSSESIKCKAIYWFCESSKDWK